VKSFSMQQPGVAMPLAAARRRKASSCDDSRDRMGRLRAGELLVEESPRD
jgi:hypothetical protein